MPLSAPLQIVDLPSVPRIKVCGVTRLEDLEVLADASVDCVGFNFVQRSPRCVDTARAQELCARAKELGLSRVAVVMDPEAAQLERLLHSIEVDFVQLHGTESIDLLGACGGKGVIKAVSWSGRDEEAALVAEWKAAFVDEREREAAPPATSTLRAFLVDAYAPEQGGGTGKVARWDLLLPRPRGLDGIPLLLAGGLNASNVADAIGQTRPDGVDTASGVESAPGVKLASAVHAFASSAVAAWMQLDR